MAFCVWMCAFPTPSAHSLWDGFDTLVGDHMVNHVRAHFWALHFSLLVHVSVVRSPPHRFDDQSFGKVFKSGSPKSCHLSLCSQDCFGFSGFTVHHGVNYFCSGSALCKPPSPAPSLLPQHWEHGWLLPRPFLGVAQA